MMGSIKAQYDCINVLSDAEFHPSGVTITVDLLCVASPNDGYNETLQENKNPQPLIVGGFYFRLPVN